VAVLSSELWDRRVIAETMLSANVMRIGCYLGCG
jgi:hypothetical protein